MPRPIVPMSRKHPLGPQVRVQVTEEQITTGVRGHSGHCMIADAIRAAVPDAKTVAVDLATCRFSDLDKGLRYVYLTPRAAQKALIEFDEGTIPPPFSFTLRGAHVTRAGHPQTNSGRRSPSRELATGDKRTNRQAATLPQRATFANAKSQAIPARIGGRRPPQLHIRREFGLRAFRARIEQRTETLESKGIANDGPQTAPRADSGRTDDPPRGDR